MVKAICQIQYTQKVKSEKDSHKDGKALFKLMYNTMYGKNMENLRNLCKTRNIDKDYLILDKKHLTTSYSQDVKAKLH